MTPNPNVEPYICYIFPEDPDANNVFDIIARRKEIVLSYYHEVECCGMPDKDVELLAQFNALVYLTAHVIANAKEMGHDTKRVWDLFGWGVQEHLNIVMLEGDYTPE